MFVPPNKIWMILSETFQGVTKAGQAPDDFDKHALSAATLLSLNATIQKRVIVLVQESIKYD